jgi:hypothetical protein
LASASTRSVSTASLAAYPPTSSCIDTIP